MAQSKFKYHILSFIVVGIFVFIAFGSGEDEKSTRSFSETNEIKPQTPKELKEQLKLELASYDKPFDVQQYRGTVTALQLEVVQFALIAGIVNKGLKSDDKETNQLASKLKSKVVARQIKEFPKMRYDYGKSAAEKMWENNIYISTSGPKNSILNLTGALFANNKNIADTQKLLADILTNFRFKEVRYRWYRGEEEFTYYKVETSKDNKLVE